MEYPLVMDFCKKASYPQLSWTGRVVCWLIMKTNTLMYQWAACFYGLCPNGFAWSVSRSLRAAAIIASQALISGSFTLVSEQCV